MKADLTEYQFAALFNPFEHFGFFAGVACGKSYTGSQFTIMNARSYPDLTGFVGANTHDQLSQATLRELFYWLEDYGYEYIVDRRPPKTWETKRLFKSFKNVITIRDPYLNTVTPIFTRVLSKSNNLRGIEFSWYWIDETRDTPKDTHDVILSRMRESKYRRGLITTTPNGEDWTYDRFVRNARKGQRLYGSMHVATIESVKAGIISQEYYDAMLATYDPLTAEQELNARHVNTKSGRAYYAAGEYNRSVRAPWGDRYPNPERPLIIGCDFNFSPSPCVWMIGQVGPDQWSDRIHWFKEIALTEASTVDMTLRLISMYPDFFYKFYGDASGNRGTTSNAGKNDYDQMGMTLQENGYLYTIDVNQSNPLVKNRVEHMNSYLKNASGKVRMTYNPYECPLLESDFKMTGWKQNIISGRGKLDTGGDIKRTHASDGAGYALYKVFPPRRNGTRIIANRNPYAEDDGGFR